MIKMWNRPFKFLNKYCVIFWEIPQSLIFLYKFGDQSRAIVRQCFLVYTESFLVLYYIISLPCFEKSHKLYNTVLNMKNEQITFHQQLCCLNSTKLRWEKLMILEQVDFALTGRGCAKFAWWNHSIIIDSKSIIF